MFILKKRGVISDWDIRMRHERPWPFLLVLAYYLMAYVLVVSSTAVEVPLFYQNVLLSLVVAIASAWVVTWKAKISMHMLAQGHHGSVPPRGHDQPNVEPRLGLFCCWARTGRMESAPPQRAHTWAGLRGVRPRRCHGVDHLVLSRCCQRQASASASSRLRSAVQPSSSLAREASAQMDTTSPLRRSPIV